MNDRQRGRRRPHPNDNPPTIDLTVGDESSPEPLSGINTPQDHPEPPIEYDQYRYLHPPTFDTDVEVINLLDDDDDLDVDQDHAQRRGTTVASNTRNARESSSSEVEFVSERPANPGPPFVSALPRNAIAPLPRLNPVEPPATGLGDFFRRGTNFVFQNFNPGALIAHRPASQHAVDLDLDHRQDDFDVLEFDYQRPAFAMNMDNRESETPQIASTPYKAPPPARDGFTRDIEEDKIMICPFCEEELAAGNGEIKQQVWIIKQCGHVGSFLSFGKLVAN
jgi:hypothetical protein